MMTGIQTTGLVALIALGATMLGCSPTPTTTVPSSDEQAEATATSKPGATPGTTQAAEKTGEGKTSAPVKVTFTPSAKSGTVVLTLTIEALADIPRGVARIVLPREGRPPQASIRVTKGDLEVDFGAIPRGAVREHKVTLDVPQATRFEIFAGVDCHITSGILLHKEAPPILLGE